MDMTGREKLQTGDFNIMGQETQPDGSKIVTLSSSHYPGTYRFRAKNLYKVNEEILEDEIL